MFFRSLISGIFLCAVQPVLAHEFWIDMESYQVAPGDQVTGEFRVGETFKGPGYSFIAPQSERFDLVRGDRVTPVGARSGDRPAFNQTLDEQGLHIIVHETTDSRLNYRDFAKFEAFVTHKDFPDTLAEHAARGLPDSGFSETYRRFAKALVAVGDGAGSDRPVGLRTEIVALANPYTDDLGAGLPVQVLLEGAPRPDTQVELFAKSADGSVEVTLHRTDADGVAVLPMAADTEYLVDAVAMLALDNQDAEAGPVWTSLWAALTFKTP